jgi:hypothetical protein
VGQAPGLRGTPSPALWRAQLAARRLYESLGFKSFGREPRALLVDGRNPDEDYYVLMLV